MKTIANKISPHHFVYLFAGGGILFAALNLNPPTGGPLFDNTDNFVLFADRGIVLEQEVQVSSGDLGSNDKLDIQKDNIINGNLFAKEIEIDKDTQINGNASYNKPKLHKDSRILGVTTTPVSLPVANLPDIPPFSVGTQDFRFTGENNTLPPGNYRDIVLEKDSRLTLSGGAYNLRKLELKENSALIHDSSTILNIQFKLKGKDGADILPGNNNLSATDLTVNYLGGKDEEDEDDKNNDEKDENGENGNEDNNDKDKKSNSRFQNFRERFSSFFKNLFGFLKKTDDRKNGGIKPVQFGNDSFLNFKLLAPKASVKLGERTTLRGQILSREIKIGKESVLSRQDVFVRESNPAEVFIDMDGSEFLVNEIMINLTNSSSLADAQSLADIVDGRVVGVVKIANAYLLEVLTNTPEGLETKIQTLINLNSPLLEGVFRNYLFDVF